MNKQLQKDAIGTAQTLINLCKSTNDCYKCPFAYWNDNYDKGIAHCTIGCPDEWDIEKASIKVEETNQEESKKIVPFNFTLKEDREAIKGRWLLRKEDLDEFLVVGFSMGCAMFAEDVVLNWGKGTGRSFGDGRDLFNQFVFADTGKPVGKPVEMENEK